MTRRRPDRLGALLLSLALVLTLWGLAANLVSSPDYTALIRHAIVTSAVALVLVVLVWLRTSWVGRTSCLVLGLAAGWTLLDAAGRSLLG